MPFDGSGGFVPIAAPDFPAVPATLIRSDQWNNVNYDIFSGFSNCVTRDGQSPATADLPMGGFGFTNIRSAAANGDVLVYGQSGASLSGLALTTSGLKISGLVLDGASPAINGLALGTRGSNPIIQFRNSAGATNEKNWDFQTTTTQFIARTLDDAGTTATSWLTVSRTGSTTTSLAFGGTSATFSGTLGVSGVVTAAGFVGPLTGNVTGNVSGSAATLATPRAINGVNFNGSAAITVPVNAAAVATNANFSVPFLSAATGNANVQTDPGFVYNPSTNLATVSITGNSTTGTATAVGTNASFAIAFLSAATGSVGLSSDSAGLSFNPSTNLLTTGGLQVGGTALGNVYAARYTAATSANVNIGTLTVQGNWLYHRIGNYVTVYGAVVVQPTSTGAFGFQVSLPVASDIGATTDLYGTGSVGLATSSGALIFGNVANNTAQFSCDSGTGTPSNTLSFTFSYQVI